MNYIQTNAPGSKDRSPSASTPLEDSLGVGTPGPLQTTQGAHATPAGREDYAGQL